MQVIIIKWWIIKLLKTLYFCTSSLETNQWNVHCFSPVVNVYRGETLLYGQENFHFYMGLTLMVVLLVDIFIVAVVFLI